MKKVLAELLTIGDEILSGQIADTNSQWMSAELEAVGITVIRKTSVGDQEGEILNAFAEAEKRAEIILITGGLGPTSDDRTKPCLARYFDCELKIHDEALAGVTEFFVSRGRKITGINRQQAALPVCCTKITNPIGTAPGMWFEKNGKVFVSLPGVPFEMKRIMTQTVIPKLLKTFRVPTIVHRIVRTAGIGESFLAATISSWEKSLPSHIKLAYLPGVGGVKLGLTAIGENPDALKKEVNDLIQAIKPLAGEYVYSLEDENLEEVIGKLLRARHLTISVAESCTGGYVSHLITSVPGSSEYFLGSIIPYAYEIKMRQLGVKPETLEMYGAVSEPTIIEMANLVRAKFNTDIGVATSGIAGPGGATLEKPVGTVWIAYSDKHHTVTRKLQLSKDRIINIQLASTLALNLIRLSIPSA